MGDATRRSYSHTSTGCGTCGWNYERLTDPETQYHSADRRRNITTPIRGDLYRSGAFAPGPIMATASALQPIAGATTTASIPATAIAMATRRITRHAIRIPLRPPGAAPLLLKRNRLAHFQRAVASSSRRGLRPAPQTKAKDPHGELGGPREEPTRAERSFSVEGR